MLVNTVALARAVSATAHALGLAADPGALQTVQLAIDAVDRPSVMSFWRTALAYETVGDVSLGDPLRRDPAISYPVIIFQQMDASEEDRRQQRNRIHLDLFVPYAQAQARIDAAVAAGGRIVTDKTLGRNWGLDLSFAGLSRETSVVCGVGPVVCRVVAVDVGGLRGWTCRLPRCRGRRRQNWGLDLSFAGLLRETSVGRGRCTLADPGGNEVDIVTHP